MKYIIDSSQKHAHQAVNTTLVLRNWYIGKRIYEEELNGNFRANYGEELIKSLSENLIAQYGKVLIIVQYTNMLDFTNCFLTFWTQ